MPNEILVSNTTVKATLVYGTRYEKLFKKTQINNLHRKALSSALERWRRVFVPLRTTWYIERSPFNYPGRSIWFNRRKAIRADADRVGPVTPSWSEIIAKYCHGWDPWSPGPVPDNILNEYRRRWGRGAYSLSGLFGGLQKDVRRELKRRAMDEIEQATSDNKFVPLIQGGKLRQTIMTGNVFVSATSTKGVSGRVTMPRGDRQNKQTGRILGMLPRWELDKIVLWFNQHMQAIIGR